jgi:hypothetical protein
MIELFIPSESRPGATARIAREAWAVATLLEGWAKEGSAPTLVPAGLATSAPSDDTPREGASDAARLGLARGPGG